MWNEPNPSRMGQLVALYIQQGGRCYWCDERMQSPVLPPAKNPLAPTRAHLKPKGSTQGCAPRGLVIACRACNTDQGALTAEEYEQWRAGQRDGLKRARHPQGRRGLL